MGGGGKAESLPWSGPAGEARHTGAIILLWEREGKALGVSTSSNERRRSAFLSRNAAQERHPRNGATPPDGVRAGLCASAHRVRREARAPAGQPKNAAPSGAQSAEKSATLSSPAHYTSLLIVTRMGRDYRRGSRERIEQVAHRGSIALDTIDPTCIQH